MILGMKDEGRRSERKCLAEEDAGNEPNPPGGTDVDRIASNRRRPYRWGERKGGGGWERLEENVAGAGIG